MGDGLTVTRKVGMAGEQLGDMGTLRVLGVAWGVVGGQPRGTRLGALGLRNAQGKSAGAKGHGHCLLSGLAWTGKCEAAWWRGQ